MVVYFFPVDSDLDGERESDAEDRRRSGFLFANE